MLTFEPITIESVYRLTAFAERQYTRSCDYTPGNLVMWSRFMQYKYAIARETLFISCISQSDISSEAFLIPIGTLPLKESIGMLQEYCQRHNRLLRLTAVPDDLAQELDSLLPNHKKEQLENWSDYIYNAQSLVTLQGKALNKKRNRYNKFISENPQYTYSRYTHSDCKEVLHFLGVKEGCNEERSMRCYEHFQCLATVRNLDKHPQPSAIIRVNGKIAAFTLAEYFGDTLYIHIEKATRDIPGAAEAINRLFAEDMLHEHPNLIYINREEDLGDPGLRQAKKAYKPCIMLHRYEYLPQ